MVTTGNVEGYSWQERKAIRDTYNSLDESDLGRNDPYIIDLKFSPIEYDMWYSLRIHSKTRYFRPEFPIGKYFADFADPIHKIVIECDGKEFINPEFFATVLGNIYQNPELVNVAK